MNQGAHLHTKPGPLPLCGPIETQWLLIEIEDASLAIGHVFASVTIQVDQGTDAAG